MNQLLTLIIKSILSSEVKSVDQLKNKKRSTTKFPWFNHPKLVNMSDSTHGSDSTIISENAEPVKLCPEYPPIQPKKIMCRAVVKKFNNSSRIQHREVWDNSLVNDINVGNVLITGGIDDDGLISAKIFSGNKLIRDHCCGGENERCPALRVFLKIRNKTYHKQIGIKYTLNNWETSETIDGKWSFTINSEFDLFSVDIPIRFTSPIWNMEFVAFCQYRYSETNVEEVWENRDGHNWPVSVGMNIQWRSFLNGSGKILTGLKYECTEEEAMQTGKMVVKRELDTTKTSTSNVTPMPHSNVPVINAKPEIIKTNIELSANKEKICRDEVKKARLVKKFIRRFEIEHGLTIPVQ